ncbi:MAG TPA: alpha-L-fucosidase [Verrucomicrobiae bacterium]
MSTSLFGNFGRLLGLTTWLALAIQPAVAEPTPVDYLHESADAKTARMEWWREARFGMFIHWGLYSIPAGQWQGDNNLGEWFLEQTHMPVSQYEKFATQFNPTNFDAVAWVKMAKAAGVKYIVFTSKHHDGFGMYRSGLTDWCLRRTPYGGDPVADLAAACRAEGIRFCLYHSIMDWHHPDWGQRRAWNDLAAPAGPPDMDRYDAYLKGQLKELLTNYGPIGLLWFDGQWESPWTPQRGADLYNYVRSLQPGIIVNNRVGKPDAGEAVGFSKVGTIGDYGTPEQHIPAKGFGPGVDWESCMTMNDHWGFNATDHNWKSTRTLVRNLIDCASKGGNFLLNVGPTSGGLIPAPSQQRLAEMGAWMATNAEAIYGTSASPFDHALPWGRCTQKAIPGGTRLYLHVYAWPVDGRLRVPGLKNKISAAWLLADARNTPLPVAPAESDWVIQVPTNAVDPISTTVVVECQGAPDVVSVGEPVYSAANVYHQQTNDYGAEFAFDGDPDSRWATDDAVKNTWLEIDYPTAQTFNQVQIEEAYPGRVQKFVVECEQGGKWLPLAEGQGLGALWEGHFIPVTARKFRLHILEASFGPTIKEVRFLRR